MSYPKRLIADAVRTIAFGAITAAYAAVGAALDSPVRIFCLSNLTNQDVYFSIDGVTDQFIVPAGSFKLIDVSTNRTTIENFFLQQGVVFYARTVGVVNPTSGSVYIDIIRS